MEKKAEAIAPAKVPERVVVKTYLDQRQNAKPKVASVKERAPPVQHPQSGSIKYTYTGRVGFCFTMFTYILVRVNV